MPAESNWFLWALMSAVFAALTAIFAKVGLDGVDSDLATLVRTMVIIVVLAAFVYFTGKWSNPLALSPKTLAFLLLSGLATGASWVCYFRALMDRHRHGGGRCSGAGIQALAGIVGVAPHQARGCTLVEAGEYWIGSLQSALRQ